VGTTDLGLLDIGLGGRRAKRNKPTTVRFGGSEYLVGAHVADYARPIERLDFNRLADTPELRALTYATLYQIVDGGETELSLVVGLPVEVLQSADAKDIVKALTSWLVGAHTFSVDGQAAAVTIAAVRVRAQPLGAFFAWGLSADGEWTRSAADWKKTIAVLDLGFNTLDLFTVRGGDILNRYTAGDTVGMRRAATALADQIRRATGRVLSLQEADGILREYLDGHKPVMTIGEQEISLTPMAKQALNVAAGEVTSFVNRQWGNGRNFDHVLLTGGGALALKRELAKSLPDAVLLDNPITANARGLAQYARRADVWARKAA
jgi:plasmid segregation protein ParM